MGNCASEDSMNVLLLHLYSVTNPAGTHGWINVVLRLYGWINVEFNLNATLIQLYNLKTTLIQHVCPQGI